MKKPKSLTPLIALLWILHLGGIWPTASPRNWGGFHPFYHLHEFRGGEILDGDTVKMPWGSIRLLWVDAPEKGQQQGRGAAQRLRELLPQSRNLQVQLLRKKDRYQRALGLITTSQERPLGLGKLWNEILIAEGLAVIDPFAQFMDPAQKWHFLQLHLRAQRNHLGVWKQDVLLYPWWYRKLKTKFSDVKN